MIEWSEPLSAAGQARREGIEQLARRAANRRRFRRRIARAAFGFGAVIAIAVWWAIPDRPGPTGGGYARAPTTGGSEAMIGRIETDPTIADRLAVNPSPPRWTVINDEEL